VTAPLFPEQPTRDPRVVSTFPSATEICYALGVEPVAVSAACDCPSSARTQPVVTRATVGSEGDGSADVDRAVADAGQSGRAHEFDADRVAALDPDVILTQSDCGVCAVDDGAVRDALGEQDASVVGLSARTIEGVLGAVQRIGTAVGRRERAARIVGDVWWRLESVRRKTPDDAPRVVVVEWMDPLQVAGNWVPELVAAAGGRHGLLDAGKPSRRVRWESLRAYAPEVLVVAPCGYDGDRTRRRLAELTTRPGWDSLPAVRRDAVHVLDTEALHRWTPRLATVVARFATLLHPTVGDELLHALSGEDVLAHEP
jgi:iron complex transport system substrate-binding protein